MSETTGEENGGETSWIEEITVLDLPDPRMCQFCGGEAEHGIEYKRRLGCLLLCGRCLSIVGKVAEDFAPRAEEFDWGATP